MAFKCSLYILLTVSLHWIFIFRHADFAHVLDFVDFVGRRQTDLINAFEIAP